MDDFVWRALAAGLGVALLAGPFGCFVVWRRMAYFGETLAHAAFLGIGLGLLLSLWPALTVTLISLGVALLLMFLQKRHELASDTLLGVLAHGSLALGLVLLSFQEDARVDLFGYLFGDILSVNRTDLGWIALADVLLLGALAALWRPLLSATVSADIARVEGVPVERVQLIFTLLLALVIALAMKLVGILLITSLLIIPAAAARRIARSPESMAAMATGFGLLAVGGGLGTSLQWDTPAGPSVVLAAVLVFVATRLVPAR